MYLPRVRPFNNPNVIPVAWRSGPHVILGEDRDVVQEAINRFAGLLSPSIRALVQWSFDFGNTIYWKTIHAQVEAMYESGKLHVLTTMNPAVVDRMWFTSPEEVIERFLFVREGEVHVLNEDEAYEIYSAYNVGIQHISEILRTHALW